MSVPNSTELHRQCTLLVQTHWARSVIEEVQAKLFASDKRTSRPEVEDGTGCLNVALKSVLRICFRDQEVA